MSEAKKIVVEHYPADRLPANFRELVPGANRVTVELTVESDALHELGSEPKYLRFWGAAAHWNTSAQDAVERVRKLRDEWD